MEDHESSMHSVFVSRNCRFGPSNENNLVTSNLNFYAANNITIGVSSQAERFRIIFLVDFRENSWLKLIRECFCSQFYSDWVLSFKSNHKRPPPGFPITPNI